MQKYFTVSYSRTGTTGTATVKLNSGITLCADQPMVLQSFSMGPNWNGQPDSHDSFMTSLPQTMSNATHFTFAKTDTVKTVTVKTPEACKGTQLDTYVGDKEIAKIVNEHDGETREITGKIFTATGTCEVPKITVCELKTKQVVTIDASKFDSTIYSKNLDDCKAPAVMIEVCDLTTNKIVKIDQKNFDTAKYGKVVDCDNVTVCDTTGKTVVTVAKHDQKDTQSTDLSKCDTKVCRVADKAVVTLKDSEVKTGGDKYTTDMSKCAPAQKTDTSAPTVELPHTGLGEVFGSAFGLAALTLAVHYYRSSRI